MNEREQIVEQLCSIIQAAVPQAEQNVKGNTPIFPVDGQDLITLNVSLRHPARVIFHRAAKAVGTKTGPQVHRFIFMLKTWKLSPSKPFQREPH